MTADRIRAGKPYSPDLRCICNESQCCGADGGTWAVNCTFCGQTWPCEDYIASHSIGEIRRQKRYTNAREYPPWPEVEDRPYDYQKRFRKWRNE
jgi:hypothetical protein